MTPERLAEIRAAGDGSFRYPEPSTADNWRRELLAEIDRLKAERERYTDSHTEWAVRLSAGTHVDCRSEDEAREKARTWRVTLRCRDALSTDWRDVEPTAP
jgi:hypothetical protein